MLLFFDIKILKRLNRDAVEQNFNISQVKVVFIVLAVFAALWFSDDVAKDIAPLVLLFILPPYLLRRSRFLSAFKLTPPLEVDTGVPSPSREVLELISGALGVIIFWAYGVVVFGFLASGVMDLARGVVSEMGELIISALVSSVWIMCLVYFASRQFSDRGFLTNVALRRQGRSWIMVGIMPFVLGLSFATFSSYLAVTREIQPQTPLNEVLETTQSMGLILCFLFLAVCVAPLVEEIVFRGYFFHVLKTWLGSKKAIYLIALTFAFLHVGQYWGDWLAIAMVTTLGFTLTILRAWTGTTLASVITHYVYNGGVTIIPIIMIALANPSYFEYKAYYPYHDFQTKESLLRKSIAHEPDLADAYNDLAWLYVEEDVELEEALVLVDKALSYAPDQPAYLDTKASVLKKLGRFEEAKNIRDWLERQKVSEMPGKLP